MIFPAKIGAAFAPRHVHGLVKTQVCLGTKVCTPALGNLSGFLLPSNGQVRFATKKAGGSTSNTRDSPGQRLGVKIWGGQFAKHGSIIIRQRGTPVHPGYNVGMGRDHTLFALTSGKVKFYSKEVKKGRRVKFVGIDPIEDRDMKKRVPR
mmetsp:Transcript_869/g.1054  ORF Transcript_869/g.1054 Transcript_869/m.1054 type:complete len:150 (-) Transcript_869:282-731(-)